MFSYAIISEISHEYINIPERLLQNDSRRLGCIKIRCVKYKILCMQLDLIHRQTSLKCIIQI
jgi:hypothetical protein